MSSKTAKSGKALDVKLLDMEVGGVAAPKPGHVGESAAGPPNRRQPEPPKAARRQRAESANRSPRSRSPAVSVTAPVQVSIEGFQPIYRTHDPAVKEADDAMRKKK